MEHMNTKGVMSFTIRSRGQAIGKVNISPILRNFAFVAFVYASLGLASIAKSDEPVIKRDVVAMEAPKTATFSTHAKEPSYEIPYTVKFGDTISELVASYAQDAEDAQAITNKMLARNKNIINNRIQQGMLIYLCSVPESHLEEFGYSADYSLFDPSYEIEDRVYYVESALENPILGEDNHDLYDVLTKKMTSLERVLKDYHIKGDAELRNYLLDYILEEYRTLTQEVEKFTHRHFADYRHVYPLTETKKNVSEFQSYAL